MKKFYIPIGLCFVLILAIGFMMKRRAFHVIIEEPSFHQSLRSDVPSEPITVYKATTPTGKSTEKETHSLYTKNEFLFQWGSSTPAIEMVKTSFSASPLPDTATSLV